MSYIIRDYANWFLYVGLIVAGGLVFLVGGCDTGMELTGEQPSEPLSATPYEQIADKQYEALKFIDTYVDDEVERLGKRPDRAEMKDIVVEAQVELLAREGYSPEEISQVKDQLGPHLEGPTTVDDSQSLSTILTKQGFTEGQKRYIRRIEVAAKSAESYSSLQKSVRRIVENSREELPVEDARMIVVLSARFEGFVRFVENASTRTNNLPSEATLLSVPGKILQNANCPDGPRPRSAFHSKWKYWRDGVLIGLAFCGGAGSLTLWSGWGSVAACVAGFDLGYSTGAYWQYKQVEKEYRTALYDWCGACLNDTRSPLWGIQKCLREFPNRYRDGDDDIPYHHRDEWNAKTK